MEDVSLDELKVRLSGPDRRKVLVFKFGGTTVGSSPQQGRLQDARRLLEERVRDGYYVVPVFSAIKRDGSDGRSKVGVTDLLLDYRNIITGAPTMRDGAMDFRRRLLAPHIDMMRDLALIPADTTVDDALKASFKAPNSPLEAVQREVNSIVGDATTFCKFIPGPGAIDNFVAGGERLAVMILAEYLDRGWRESGFPYRAESATASEVGILTDGQFGDAHIIDESIPLVYNLLNRYKKRGVIPIVTGFDGIYKVQEDGRTFRYRTTLGRSGSDLTATYIGYAMMAEATVLVKETDGVLTANPKHVPAARTIPYLTYDLAVEAGNIQRKAVRPALQGSMDVLVFNPKNPAAMTRIGPDRDDLTGLMLICDPVACRYVSVHRDDSAPPFAILEDMRRYALEPLEVVASGDHLAYVRPGLKSTGNFERLLVEQHGCTVEATPAWYVKVVGKVDRAITARFNALIEQFVPLSSARFHPGAKALTACFAQEGGAPIGTILQAIHREFLAAAAAAVADAPAAVHAAV